MKNCILLVLFLLIFQTVVKAQVTEKVRDTKKIISKRDLYINGGLRSGFGGKSRTYIKIDLPPNTIEWYYSFSTTLEKSNTKTLNLGIQLAKILTDPTGITSNIASAIDVPKGVASADIYLLDRNNLNSFFNKEPFRHYSEGMVENTKQAVVKIDDLKLGTWYLGIRNPSSLYGINLSIEVVAIIENKIIAKKTEKQQKAEMLGNLGWGKFEKGEYEKCIEYSDKSNEEFKLGWVQANKALATLMLGDEVKATGIYINSIPLIKKQAHAKYFFNEILKDIDNVILIKKDIAGIDEIKKLIELQRY